MIRARNPDEKVKVIETNLSMTWDYLIQDHQARIVEVDNWDDYCKAFDEYRVDTEIWFKPLTSMLGNTVNRNCILSNLKYDKSHLSCDIYNRTSGYTTKILAYKVD